MTMILKQSTAVVISFGPFVSPTDGVTLQTGLVSAIDNGTTGILLSKNGGTLTIRHATITASTYDAYGMYKVTLDTTDTNTVGTLRVAFAAAASCLPVWQDFMVQVAVDATALLPTALTADGNIKADALRLGGTAQTGRDIGASVLLSNGTGAGQLKLASGYVAMTWADIAAPTTTMNLSGTTTKAVTDRVTANTDQIEGSDATNQIRDSILSDATRFPGASIDAAISSRLAAGSYTAPDNTGIASAAAAASTAATNSATILARLGAWTGTGVNTILGGFKALLSKVASVPSDIGGTFDPATDSTEAIRDQGDAAWVTGNTTTPLDATQTQAAAAAAITAGLGGIADAVHDEVVDGSTTFRASTRLHNSVLGGKSAGGGTASETFRDLGDTKDRVAATVNTTTGDRTAITLDLT